MKNYLEKYSSNTLQDSYCMIREGAAILDGSEFCMMKISGDGAADCLDQAATKDIQYLNIDTVSECLILNEQATALGIAYICRLDEDFIVLTPPGSEKAARRIMNEADGKAIVTDMKTDYDMIFIEGPKSYSVVRDVLNVDVEMLPLRGVQVIPDWKGHEIIVMRIGRSGEYAYNVITDSECMSEIAVQIMTYGKDNDIKLGVASEEAMTVCMLETLEPDFRKLPAEDYDLFTLGIQWMIQYEKENYCGHDALMELFGRERNEESVCFKANERSTVEVGSDVKFGGDVVGKVIQTAYSPAQSCAVGTILLRKDLAVSGIILEACDKDGSFSIETVSYPITRPISWDIQI